MIRKQFTSTPVPSLLLFVLLPSRAGEALRAKGWHEAIFSDAAVHCAVALVVRRLNPLAKSSPRTLLFFAASSLAHARADQIASTRPSHDRGACALLLPPHHRRGPHTDAPPCSIFGSVLQPILTPNSFFSAASQARAMDNAVLDTSNPAVHTKEIELRLYIAPAWLADPMEGIREQLDRMVLRYVDQLDGVLLSYEDLRLKMSALGQPLGRIRDDLPEIHLRVIFTATYFAPKAGDRMDCVVSRIGTDHIALLVMGVFNGTVALPPDWDPAKRRSSRTRRESLSSAACVTSMGYYRCRETWRAYHHHHNPRRERRVRRALERVPLPRAAAAADSGRQSGRGRPLQQRPLRRRRCLLRRQWPRPPPPLLPIRRLTGMARVPASGRRRQRRRRRSGNERRRRPHDGPRERKREEEAPLGRDGRPKGSVSAVFYLMCLSSTVQ